MTLLVQKFCGEFVSGYFKTKKEVLFFSGQALTPPPSPLLVARPLKKKDFFAASPIRYYNYPQHKTIEAIKRPSTTQPKMKVFWLYTR